MTLETAPKLNVLCVDVGGQTPAALRSIITRSDWNVTCVSTLEQARADSLLQSADAAVLCLPADADAPNPSPNLEPLLDALNAHRVGTVLIDPSPTEAPLQNASSSQSELLARLPATVSADELFGRLTTMSQYGVILRRAERELNYLQRIGRKLTSHFTTLDEELRLASRLQHDFLPKNLPQIGPARFHVLYRPASWVSGDIYDVFRLDEDHVGFYVVDAVGHGVAAGLLTMFIRNALPTKIIEQDDYRLVSPAQALGALNVALAEQNLPGNQFVTACYCLLNTRTLELTVARGGHPYPLRTAEDGRLTPIRAEGSLLGIFGQERYEETTVPLAPGGKLFLFSDGLEVAFPEQSDRREPTYPYERKLQTLAHRPAAEIVGEFAESLDRQQGSINPRDDVTLLVLEIADA